MGYFSKDIWGSWTTDPSARLGLIVFCIWSAGTVIHWNSLTHSHFIPTALAATLVALLGIVGALNALIYIAFALFALAPIRSIAPKSIALVFSIFWMPVWAWLALPYLGNRTPIVSLGAGAIFLIIQLILRRRIHETKTDHHSA